MTMMNSPLQLDPTGGELLTSAWKELDAKFLSNDTLTSGQRMLQPVSPADRLDHILSHSSLYIRASDLILYLENVGVFHIKQHFQLIVDAIFGYNTKYPGWALRAITKTSNPREAAVVLKLLGATGSLLNLATRLLEDPGFIIEVGLDKLPFALSQRILQGDVPPYFGSRLCVTDPYPQTAMTSPMIKCLRANSFEFFFLSFTAHICTLKGVGSTSDYLVGWGTMTDNLYNNLLDDYLAFFFPCNGHGVPCDNFRLSYQQTNDSGYIAQTLRSQMINVDPNATKKEATSPRLLKSSLLMEHSHSPTPRSDAFFRKSQIHKEVWRTETILLICTEMWMAHAPGAATYKNSSPASTDQFGKVMLPTVDVVKSVRMLVRHFHFFLNCISSNVMHPMEELKRDVYPTYQKRLYKFLRHLFYNWPLDNSFRIVYETWLSYVQPWRYVHFERIRSATNKEVADEHVDSRWFSFIQENVLFYTKLFNLMLTRMSRVDFATTKNAMMFYRVAKVFTTQDHLKTMLIENDNVILSYEQPYAGQLNGIPSRSPSSAVYANSFGRYPSPSDSQRGTAMFRIASLRQIIKDWEYADFTFEPLFSDSNKKLMISLIDSAKTAKNQLQEVIDATIVQQGRNQSWWSKLLGTNQHYNLVVGQSINELNRAISQLDVAASQFASFFGIMIIEPPESFRPPVFTPTKLPRTTFIGNSLDGSILDGTDNRITVLPSGTFTCDMLVPVGNPDYAAARSDECAVLVGWVRGLSGLLNERFAGDIMRLYFQRNWKGRLARATFSEPVEYFDIEKKGRVREKIRKVLPPRISLRFLSSVNFLAIVMVFFLVCLMFGLWYGISPTFLFFWLIFIIVRAVTEPETKLDDVVYMFGNRNYNVDFRGQKERPGLEQG